MSTTQGPFRLRPGCPSDTYACASIYLAAFSGDSMLDILFPEKHRYPTDLHTHLYRIFQARFWSSEWRLTMAVDDKGQPVGFSYWKRPKGDISFYERWLTPFSWFAPLIRLFISLKSLLVPLRLDPKPSNAFSDVYTRQLPSFMTTPRRRDAWYLSTLGVFPQYQGLGLGRQLMKPTLEEIDAKGEAAWLVSVHGKDEFYAKFGFEERARMNVDEMSTWDGGSVMFRE